MPMLDHEMNMLRLVAKWLQNCLVEKNSLDIFDKN